MKSPIYDPLLPNEKILMPRQATPFNGDFYVVNEFLKLRANYNIKRVVELGTCVGGSTKFFGENFDHVDTIEIMPDFQEIAKSRCEDLDNIIFHLGSTIDELPKVLKNCTNETILFIDSHWNTLPLFDELSIIANSGLKPCIVVHDCLVPDEPNLGYDSYQGVDISYDVMKKYLDAIYGEEGYSYYYNSDALSTEVKRGILYCTPNK
ncbi:MAG: hypothetical protein ACP5N7_01205 [Candidatus Pacearchaeota archaeon]